MITRGSRFFYAAAAVGLLGAIFYGFLTGASDHGGVVATFTGGGLINSLVGPLTLGWKGWVGEHIGYTVLLSFGAVMLALGGFTTAFRDCDAEAIAEIEGIPVAALSAPVKPWGISYWPALAALSGGAVVVGLVFSGAVFYAGVVGLVVAGFEWTVRAWSERATGDPALNSEYRNRILRPLEVPVGAVLVLAVIALAVSRVLLAVPRSASIYVIVVLAAVVFGFANLLARRPDLTGNVIVAVVVVGALVLIIGGIAAGIAGTRDVQEHHSEGGMAVVVHTVHTTAADPLSDHASTTGTGAY